VQDAVLVAHLGGGRCPGFGFGKNRVNALGGIRIQHKKLSRVRSCVPQKFQPSLSARRGVLVAEKPARRILSSLPAPMNPRRVRRSSVPGAVYSCV